MAQFIPYTSFYFKYWIKQTAECNSHLMGLMIEKASNFTSLRDVKNMRSHSNNNKHLSPVEAELQSQTQKLCVNESTQ